MVDWETGFEYVAAFVESHGHALVTSFEVSEDGFSLWKWVEKQRQAGRAGKLSEDRRARLAALPRWYWSRQEAKGNACMLSGPSRGIHPALPQMA